MIKERVPGGGRRRGEKEGGGKKLQKASDWISEKKRGVGPRCLNRTKNRANRFRRVEETG